MLNIARKDYLVKQAGLFSVDKGRVARSAGLGSLLGGAFGAAPSIAPKLNSRRSANQAHELRDKAGINDLLRAANEEGLAAWKAAGSPDGLRGLGDRVERAKERAMVNIFFDDAMRPADDAARSWQEHADKMRGVGNKVLAGGVGAGALLGGMLGSRRALRAEQKRVLRNKLLAGAGVGAIGLGAYKKSQD